MPENTPIDQHKKIKLFNTEEWLYEDFEIGFARTDQIERHTTDDGKPLDGGKFFLIDVISFWMLSLPLVFW